VTSIAKEMEDRLSAPLRVLFCMGVGQSYSDAPPSTREAVLHALEEAFADLRERFRITVLGTMDDDRLRVVPTQGWPWTAYILADVPDIDTVMKVCNLLRETPVEDSKLSRYVCMEARVGRRLFYGNE
jgi:hypothetical protein